MDFMLIESIPANVIFAGNDRIKLNAKGNLGSTKKRKNTHEKTKKD